MRGYLYHNIVLVKSNLIAMGVFEVRRLDIVCRPAGVLGRYCCSGG